MSFAWHSGMAKIWFCSIDCDGPPALAGLWTDPVTCCPWVLTPSSSWWLPKGANRVAQRLLAFERQPTRDGLRPQTWGWGLREEVVSVSQRSDDEGNYNREKRPGETRGVCVCVCVCACVLSHVLLFATAWTVACPAPLSMEFSRSGLPFPSPGHLPDPQI